VGKKRQGRGYEAGKGILGSGIKEEKIINVIHWNFCDPFEKVEVSESIGSFSAESWSFSDPISPFRRYTVMHKIIFLHKIIYPLKIWHFLFVQISRSINIKPKSSQKNLMMMIGNAGNRNMVK
jgi:hypothetical protein